MSQESQTRRDFYRHWVAMPTRWMDNDIYGHVNNVTYYSYFDTAANEFLIRVAGLDIENDDAVGFVVASNCQFREPVAFPEALEVGVRVNHIGTSSVEYGLAVFRKNTDNAVAFGSITHVFVSKQSQRPVSLPSNIRRAFDNLASDQG